VSGALLASILIGIAGWWAAIKAGAGFVVAEHRPERRKRILIFAWVQLAWSAAFIAGAIYFAAIR